MLIWLASFPRAGSSLTQQVLWRCFGVSIAKPNRTRTRPALEKHTGPDRFGENLSLPDMVARARAEDGPVIVKTHALPEGDDPAIVVVRDGRAVMSSFAHHQTNLARSEMTIEDAITNSRRNWSDHVTAWLDAPVRKVVLKYEDLSAGEPEALRQLGAFLGMPQIAEWENPVEEMRLIRPRHMPQASNDHGIAEVERECGDLFWREHGATMARLGYTR